MDKNNGALKKATSVGDLLAMERTRLANDRTILAYIRTALAFFATAAALIEFFDQNKKLEITAYITIFFGVVILIVGFYSYYRSKKLIKNVMRNNEN